MRRFTLLFLCLLCLAPFARADEETGVLIDRLDRMERDMQNLQMEVFRGDGEKPARASGTASRNDGLGTSALNRIDARLSELERNLRDLTGRIEELNHQLGQQQSLMDKTASDNELRLQMIEQKIQAAAVAVPPSPPANQTPIVAPTGSNPAPAETKPLDAKSAYEQAIGLIQSGDYAAAQNALQNFLTNFEGDPLTANAQYWLGETHYVRGDFKSAAIEFAKAYKQYPKGGKTPDSLLKLGLALEKLDNGKQACVTFGKLLKEYPKAAESIKARAADEFKNMKCAAPVPAVAR